MLTTCLLLSVCLLVVKSQGQDPPPQETALQVLEPTLDASDDFCENQVTSDIKLQLAKDSLKQVRSLMPTCRDGKDDTGPCRKRDRAVGYVKLIFELLDGLKLNYRKGVTDCTKCPALQEERRKKTTPRDCSEVLEAGNKTSGVYHIYPKSFADGPPLSVFCDMETDGGGWTVIQRRGNFSAQTDFNRGWEDYKKGFGDLDRDFWLGNENIHAITDQDAYALRIAIGDSNGQRKYAQHNSFKIGDEKTNYVLKLSRFNGTYNELGYHNNAMFSTKDRQNDGKPNTEQCANIHQGGWWYTSKDCGLMNLNGKYMPGVESKEANWWFNWNGFKGLFYSEMKLRPAKTH